MIATTINMHPCIYKTITRAAELLSISRRNVIVNLLMRIMRDMHIHFKDIGTVKYQEDNPRGDWRCFTIRFKPDENEFFADLRRFCKCSVSLLVAIAVKRYLKEILGETDENAHNNAYFRNHKINYDSVDGVICWRIYWEPPDQSLQPLSG